MLLRLSAAQCARQEFRQWRLQSPGVAAGAPRDDRAARVFPADKPSRNTLMSGCAGRWAGAALHRPAAIRADGVSRRGSASRGVEGLAPIRWKWALNEFARHCVRGSRESRRCCWIRAVARRGKYLCGRKFVAGQDSSGENRRESEQETAGSFAARLQDILRKAIVMRGSSISDFLDADGEPGEYQRHHRAYGREGKKCHRCGTMIRRAIVAGRSSYFCPKCQPAPRPRRSKRKDETARR